MIKRFLNDQEYPEPKKVKIGSSIDISKIVEFSGGKWLVEWDDKSRTWENFYTLKDKPEFETYVLLNMKNSKNILPEYIN